MESKLSVVVCWTAVVAFLASVDGASGVVPIQDLCFLHCPRPSTLDSIRCRCVGPKPIDELLPSPFCQLRACPRSYIPCSKYKRDSRGCPTCECLSSCPRLAACPYRCPYGRTYETDSQGCRVCKCKPKPVCPVLRCRNCPYGYQKDSKGCDTCRCQTKPVLCGPVCAIFCPGGNVLDSRGCPACRCKSERLPIEPPAI